MSRSVSEWRGKTDDEPVPPRVRLRVLYRFDLRCAKCTRFIRPAERWTCDHAKALINGGENREKNLQPLCCNCDPIKTAHDIAEKSATYGSRLRHHGIKRQTSRPLPGTKASGWRKKFDGTVERRSFVKLTAAQSQVQS